MSDLAVFTDPGIALDERDDPATFVMLACERAKDWLALAVEHGAIDQIVELKSQAEAIRIYSIQKQLGKDSELAAAEIVRRAERGLGLAIRAGQEAGEVRREGEGGGWPPKVADNDETRKISPTAVFAHASERRDTYAVTDAVTDEQFEEALEEAKAEDNLSRANVVRKVAKRKPQSELKAARLEAIRDLAGSGHRASQIAELVGLSEERVRWYCRQQGIKTADAVVGSARRIDPDRVVNETVSALEGLVMGLNLLGDLTGLDPSRVGDWSISLSSSLRSLNRLSKQLKEMSQ